MLCSVLSSLTKKLLITHEQTSGTCQMQSTVLNAQVNEYYGVPGLLEDL